MTMCTEYEEKLLLKGRKPKNIIVKVLDWIFDVKY